MRRALLAGVWLAAVLLTAGASAERPAVIVTPGSARSFRAAVQTFQDADGARAERFRADLDAALLFSGIFELIDPKAFLGPVKTRSFEDGPPLVCQDWTTVGADAFVEGRLVADPERLSVEFRLWDTARCRRLLSKRYRQERTASPTVLAKRVADDIVGAFTGVRGVASTEIAFVSNRAGKYKEVFVMDADGANARAATANRSINNFPSWSPDGDAIVYTSYRYQNRPLLYLSTRGRGKPGLLFSKLTGRSQYRGEFAPSGRSLAVVMSDNGASEIYTVQSDGVGLKRLTRNGAIDISPSWSPDGERMAFVSDRSGAPQVYVMDADGGNVRRLTFTGSYNTHPAWSPDGRWIAYETRVQGQFDIWLIDPGAEGGGIPLVTHPRSDESPTWSPDSRKLAFSSTRRGRADIYVIDVGGQDATRITSGAGDNTAPSWGPYAR